jgi:hypothetical protein
MHRPSLVTFRAMLLCDRPLGKLVGAGPPEPTANYRGRITNIREIRSGLGDCSKSSEAEHQVEADTRTAQRLCSTGWRRWKAGRQKRLLS